MYQWQYDFETVRLLEQYKCPTQDPYQLQDPTHKAGVKYVFFHIPGLRMAFPAMADSSWLQ